MAWFKIWSSRSSTFACRLELVVQSLEPCGHPAGMNELVVDRAEGDGE